MTQFGEFTYPGMLLGTLVMARSQLSFVSTKCEDINGNVYKISLWEGFGPLMSILGCSTHLGISVFWGLMHMAPINHHGCHVYGNEHTNNIHSASGEQSGISAL